MTRLRHEQTRDRACKAALAVQSERQRRTQMSKRHDDSHSDVLGRNCSLSVGVRAFSCPLNIVLVPCLPCRCAQMWVSKRDDN